MSASPQNVIVKPNVSRTPKKAVVVHFAGDSGDGMQVTGALFTAESAIGGNDIQTFPDFPAEIRAPAGTIPGVSGFQLRFSDHLIYTPGDKVDVLVAMNPAALVSILPSVKRGGTLVIDEDKFTDKEFKKAGLTESPLTEALMSSYHVISVPLTHLTLAAVESEGLSRVQSRRAKNMFALGIMFWLFDRDIAHTVTWLQAKFSKTPEVAQLNVKALKAGYQFSMSAELFEQYYAVGPVTLPPGAYRQITANQAVAWACVAAASLSQRPVMLAGYPITPASDILHLASHFKDSGVMAFQAEDEMAAIGAAIGAAYGGHLGITCTSGPGLDLKMESIGLAAMTELPLVIVNVQRAGPSTGMPTKTEQSDLLAVIHGRHGECPVPVIAPATPSDSFYCVLEAFRLAMKYMTPVFVLTDGYIASASEAWKIPAVDSLPDMKMPHREIPEPFMPYQRDEKTLARPWVTPGTPGKMHRIGGLEKAENTGGISYSPENHARMVATRAQKIAQIETNIEALSWLGPKEGQIVVVTWGSSYGAVRTAVESLQQSGCSVTGLLIRVLMPLPSNLKAILSAFETVLVAELNTGQLCQLIRAETLIDARSLGQVTGKPYSVDGLIEQIVAAAEGGTV